MVYRCRDKNEDSGAGIVLLVTLLFSAGITVSLFVVFGLVLIME